MESIAGYEKENQGLKRIWIFVALTALTLAVMIAGNMQFITNLERIITSGMMIVLWLTYILVLLAK